jgi:uncharacterized protein YndB with AHSA1/START domain
MTTATTKPEFRIERVFDAPRERVWSAWTDPVKVAQWFGPKGCTVEVLASDFRPGGSLRARMQQGEYTYYGKFVYREIVAPERLAYEHGFADPEGNFTASPFGGEWPLRLYTVVTLEELGDKTKLVLTWTPLEASAAEEAAFAHNLDSMTGGWGGSFDKLDELLAG